VALECDPQQRIERATRRFGALREMTKGISRDLSASLTVIESGLRPGPETVPVYIDAARNGNDQGLRSTPQRLAFVEQQELAPDIPKCRTDP
jgi:hypothetical protein